MSSKQLVRGSIIKAIFGAVEFVALIGVSIITFSNSGADPWGYWGNVLIVFTMLSPIIIYVISSIIFNIFNMRIVMKKRHTPESIKKYKIISLVFFVWGIITGGLYGAFVPVFILENIFLVIAYWNEAADIKNK